MPLNNTNWRPRVCCYADEVGDTRTYYLPNEELVIKGDKKLQQDLLHYCTGHFTMDEILVNLSPPYDRQELLGLTEVLFKNGVLVNSREYWRAYHPYSNNPMPLFEALSDHALNEL
ncbi:MAG: hypothetical protein U1C49_01365, partial [Candidatus Andersenbacteria bacterium]|nr:hypothetical protein [Candidatus Andersenbacteria bacterium]